MLRIDGSFSLNHYVDKYPTGGFLMAAQCVIALFFRVCGGCAQSS